MVDESMTKEVDYVPQGVKLVKAGGGCGRAAVGNAYWLWLVDSQSQTWQAWMTDVMEAGALGGAPV